MGHMRKLDQGTRSVFGAIVHGDEYPIPAGGSDSNVSVGTPSAADAATSLLEGGGSSESDEGAEPPPTDEGDGEGVQPSSSDGQEQPSGQDLIAPYLEGLDGDVRSVVEERLRRFQSDTDSNANRKIQDLSEKLNGFQQFAEDPEQLAPVIDLYAWLMQEPQEALPWVVEALHTERGVDLQTLRDPLMEKLGIEQPPSGGSQEPASQSNSNGNTQQQSGQDGAQPLTREDLQEFMQQEREREQQEQQELRQREEAQQQVTSWMEESLDKFGLTDRVPDDSPMRKFVLQQAHELMQSGKVRNGRVAIESAVEQVKNFLDTQQVKGSDGKSEGGAPSGKDPRTANGGSSAQAPDQVDLNDRKSRVSLAADLLEASQREE